MKKDKRKNTDKVRPLTPEELAAEEKARYMEIIAKLSDAQKGSELNGATKV